jgi:hypothetical protein
VVAARAARVVARAAVANSLPQARARGAAGARVAARAAAARARAAAARARAEAARAAAAVAAVSRAAAVVEAPAGSWPSNRSR